MFCYFEQKEGLFCVQFIFLIFHFVLFHFIFWESSFFGSSSFIDTGQGKVERQGQGKISVRLKQSNHNPDMEKGVEARTFSAEIFESCGNIWIVEDYLLLLWNKTLRILRISS